MSNKVTYQPVTHSNKKVILIKFEYDKALNERVKKLKGAKWSTTLKAWYVPDNDHYRELFKLNDVPKSRVGKRVLARVYPVNQVALTNMENTLQLKGYSPNTYKTYINEFSQLLYFLKDKPVDALDTETIKAYLLICAKKWRLTENQINSRFNAIKFYFEQVLHREKIFLDIPRPKKASILPKVINAQDIKKMFAVTENLKHNTMLKLCYGMGLRVSEIVNLKITDIDGKNMQVLIERGKGKKDRYVNLPESILLQLREYFKEYKPKQYLFEGQYGGKYSLRSAQQVFKDALNKAKINKRVGIHSLRHSYATHLLENGTDISYIQKLLGHNDIKTTLIYAHVSKRDIKKVRSPLDDL